MKMYTLVFATIFVVLSLRYILYDLMTGLNLMTGWKKAPRHHHGVNLEFPRDDIHGEFLGSLTDEEWKEAAAPGRQARTAHALARSGKTDAAIAAYKVGLVSYPASLALRVAAVVDLTRAKRYGEARQFCQPGLALPYGPSEQGLFRSLMKRIPS